MIFLVTFSYFLWYFSSSVKCPYSDLSRGAYQVLRSTNEYQDVLPEARQAQWAQSKNIGLTLDQCTWLLDGLNGLMSSIERPETLKLIAGTRSQGSWVRDAKATYVLCHFWMIIFWLCQPPWAVRFLTRPFHWITNRSYITTHYPKLTSACVSAHGMKFPIVKLTRGH